MNEERILRDLLLQQSGELSRRGCRRLERELKRHPEAARLKKEAEKLIALSRTSSEETAMPDKTLRAILGEARTFAAETNTASIDTAPAWRPAWVMAATVLFVVAGWLLVRDPGSTLQVVEQPPAVEAESDLLAWDYSVDDDLNEVDSLLAMASDENGNGDLDALVSELMELEGTEI